MHEPNQKNQYLALAVREASEIISEARRDLAEAPIDSVGFGHAEGRIEAATRIIQSLRELENEN